MPYGGLHFVLLVVAAPVLAVALTVRDTRVVWAATGALCAAAEAVLFSSRSVGLPQMCDDVGRWTERLALIAFAAETLVAGLAA